MKSDYTMTLIEDYGNQAVKLPTNAQAHTWVSMVKYSKFICIEMRSQNDNKKIWIFGEKFNFRLEPKKIKKHSPLLEHQYEATPAHLF